MTTKFVLAGIAALLLSACSSPPKPPVVDGLDRRPINSPATLENLRQRALLAPVSKREIEERKELATLQKIEAEKKARSETTKVEESPKASESSSSSSASFHSIFTVVFRHHFPYGGTRLVLSDKERTELLLLAKNAEHIEIRGRTDGHKPSPGDEAVATARGKAARDWLIKNAGVDAGIISINSLSAGDFIANNKTPEGRALNRRVDVHFFSSKNFL